MANTTDTPVVDYSGCVLFHCRNCGVALTEEDFFGLNLRLPEPGESRDDYCDAELIEDAIHAGCASTLAS
jgi:hypothetical protein